MSENKVYERNMRAIEKTYPKLLTWVKESPEVDWFRPNGAEPGKRNASLFSLRGYVPMYDSGQHPQKHPRKVARGMKAQLRKDTASVVVGMGMGYFVDALLRTAEKGHTVAVVEPVAHIVRAALANLDFSRYITEGHLVICPSKEDLAYMVSLVDGNKSVQGWLLLMDPVTFMRAEYVDVRAYASDIVNQVQCSSGTLRSAGEEIAANDIESFPYLVRIRGVAELAGMFKGLPAACVSTGPSLSRNIHLLREYQNRVVIVAVGQALRPLLAHNIRPDFFATVDFGAPNMTHFEGLLDTDVPMVCITQVHADLVRKFQGPKFVANSPKAANEEHQDVTSLMAGKGSLESGGSVAHFAFSIARAMGCSPILLVGQDLALTGGRSHTEQADVGGIVETDGIGIKWLVKDPCSGLCEEKYPQGHGMGPVMWAQGYYGDAVMTNIGLQGFRFTLENMIEASECPVYNCTEGGSQIRGAEPMWLDDALEKFCNPDPTWKKPGVPEELLTTPAKDADELIEKAIPMIGEDIEVLDKIIDNARTGLSILPKMTKAWNKPKLLAMLGEENREASEAAFKESQKSPLVMTAIFGANREIANKKLNVGGKIEDLKAHRKDLQTRIKRNRIILTAAMEAAEKLKPSYQEAAQRLRDHRRDPSCGALDPDPDLLTPWSLSDEEVEGLFKAGNWAKPLLWARKVMDVPLKERAVMAREDEIKQRDSDRAREREEDRDKLCLYSYLLTQGQGMCRRTQTDDTFKKAEGMFRRAVNLMPEKQNARWGLATTLMWREANEEAITEYEKLVEADPENKRYRFELGQAMLKAGRVQEGLQLIREVMKDTTEFHSFLPHVARLYRKHEDLWPEALMAYDEYLAENPLDHDAVADRASLLMDMGREEEAKTAMAAATAIVAGKIPKAASCTSSE